MFRFGFILCCLQSFYLIEQIYGHGYLADPPARSSAWLFDKDFDKCCRYYNHAEMSCGGTYHQWTVNGGKCSICGEAYDLKNKSLSVGSPMYLGKIVRTYTQGATIPVTVVLTANHLGIFEFRVCSIDDDPSKEATQSCLDLNILRIANNFASNTSDNESTQYNVTRTAATVRMHVTLPSTLVCKHCVFQWKYRTGNSWGTRNGKACLGCGKANEEFYGCSDIAIKSADESIIDETTKTSVIISPTTKVSTEKPKTEIISRKCTSKVTFSESFDLSSIMDQYCSAVCSANCASDSVIGNEILYKGCISTCDKLCLCE